MAAVLVIGAPVLAWSAAGAHADAVLQPSVVDFGEQPRGVQGAPVTVELVNTGSNPFRVYRSEVNSGPDNADFVVATDGCSGVTVEPGGRCPLAIAFRPTGFGPTSQTVGLDVSGPDYRTFGERAAVVVLNGTGIEAGAAPPTTRGRAPGPSRPGPPVPIGLAIPAAGLGALGLGFLMVAAAGRAPAARRT